MPTPLRNVRVPDDLWRAAQEKAEREGRSVSDVLLAALKRYVRK
jgi:predicted HicB family RNase H-like nuclease